MEEKSVNLLRRMRRILGRGRLVLLGFCSLFVFSTSYAYQKPNRGWFFYQSNPKPKKKKPVKVVKAPKPKPVVKTIPKPKPKPKPKKEKKKGFVFPVRPDAPEPIKEFLLHPNEKTAEKFLAWQYKYFRHLEKIGFVLRSTYLAKAPEVYPAQGYPEGELASALYYNQYEPELITNAIEQLRHRFGLIVFYGGSCPICRQELPTLIGLGQTYHIPIRAVNVDGNMLDLPIKQVYNPGLAQRYGITRIPTVVAVLQKKNGEVKQAVISVGLTPADIITATMLQFLKLEGAIKGINLNFNFSQGIVNEVR